MAPDKCILAALIVMCVGDLLRSSFNSRTFRILVVTHEPFDRLEGDLWVLHLRVGFVLGAVPEITVGCPLPTKRGYLMLSRLRSQRLFHSLRVWDGGRAF